MTPEIEKNRRELFEAWFDKEVLPTISYGSPDILKRQMWRPFNAALDAVVIVLPPEWPPVSERDEGANEMLDACRLGIEQTGLGLKIKD